MSTMSTNGEDGAAKSRKSAAKVGGEFGALGGIVLVGGVLAVGIGAGALAYLRRRPRKMLDKPGEKYGENSSLEGKMGVPMSENVEEVEPILEIANIEKLSVENFSPMDLEFSAKEKSINRSKGDESPRSHFSISTSSGTSASVSSDSEDLVEINHMRFKENGFVPQEETYGKASFDFRVVTESECISGKELMEPNDEYEESVDSFDGLEDCEKVCGLKVNDCKESGKSSLVCKERFDAEKCVLFVGGGGEDDNVSIKDDGSIHDEKFHVSNDGIDAADLSCEGRIVEIDGVLKVSEFVKGDLCLDRQEKDQMGADAKEETVLSNNEDLKEKVGGSEDLNCDKEESWQAVICQGECVNSVKEDCSEDFPRREGDSNVDFGHCDERGEHGEVDISEERFGPIQQQSREEIVGTNQEVLFCREECLQERFECNEEPCGEENTDSEESDNHMVNVGYKEKQCSTVVSKDFKSLDYSRGVSDCEEKCQHGELEFSEETSCHIEEEIQQESVKPKEFESIEVDGYSRQDAAPHELPNAKDEIRFCKEKHPEQKTFERVNSEEKPEEREVDLAHEGKQCQHGTVDSRGIEVLDYKGSFSHSDESDQQKEEVLEQNCSPINETAQNKELEREETEVHDRQDGYGQVSVDVNEYVVPCKEQSIQEQNLQLILKQCPQEKTDAEDVLKGCHVDTAHKGEQCQHGTVDFLGLDYKGGSNNCVDVGQPDQLEESEENLFPINEQSQQETLKHKELDCKEVKVPGHQDGHKSEPDGANKKKKCVLNVEQCSQENTDCIATVANKVEQCQIGKVDSRNFGGLDEDASHENGSCQYGAVGTRGLDDLNRDSHSEKGQFENERLNSKENMHNENFENGSLKSMEDIENGRLNSKGFAKLDIDLEEKLSPQEKNIKEPQEALEVSVMEMCEENAVHSKETGIDGDAHVFKDKPQQEAMHSNESRNFVEDIFVYHELCKETTCEPVESEYVEENMPIAQEYKQEIVNSVDIHDSVECIPVTTMEFHKEINESDELGGVAIKEPQEALPVYAMEMECEENALHAKETGVDGDAHIFKEKPQEETVDSNESQNFVDIFVNHELCKGATCESEQSEFVEESMPISQEEYKQEIVNSVDIQDSVECTPVTTLSDNLGGVAIKESQEALKVSVMEMECEENAVNQKETGVDGDAHTFKEKPQEETMDSNESKNLVENIFINHELCKGTTCESEESEFVEENMPIAQEVCKQEIVNSVEIQDSVECMPVTTLQCHREMNESDDLGGVAIKEPQEALEVSVMEMECEENAVHSNETGIDEDGQIFREKPQQQAMDSNESQNFVKDTFVYHELCKGTTCESKKSEFVEERMPISQEEYKQEIVNSVDIQDSVECMPITTLRCHGEINETDDLGGVVIKDPQEALEVSVMEMECEESAVDSNETGIDEDAQIFRENLQQEVMDSNESQNFVEDTFVYHELCKGTTCESEKSEFIEESMPIAQEEYKQEIVNSVDIQDSVECMPVTTLQCHKEINESDELDGVAIKEPQEALEVSVMEMECEENAVHPNETVVDGDEHIFKEKPQEETMDSNESQNLVEDILVNHELCKGTTCESEESDFVEENMPTAQEEYKQEIINSVECIPVTTLQCHREMNESDELEGAVIPGEKYQGVSVYLEQLELSDNFHSHNEPCKQEERLGEQFPPSLKEIVAFEQANHREYQNQCNQSQEKEIDAKDLGYSSSIALELSPNDPDCTEAYESSHENPQTYNRPEVIGTEDSEYPYGDTIEKEKFQLETVDQVANNYYREEQEICPEQEEVNYENSSTRTHHLNDQYEENQDISTTTMTGSCKLLSVLEEFKLEDESTDSKSVAPLASEQKEASNTSSITEREKKEWESNSEEGKSLWMKHQRPLYMRTRILVSLFAALLAFLFAYKYANVPETVFAT